MGAPGAACRCRRLPGAAGAAGEAATLACATGQRRSDLRIWRATVAFIWYTAVFGGVLGQLHHAAAGDLLDAVEAVDQACLVASVAL